MSKSAGAEEFVNAVRQVGRGGHYIEREIAAELAIGKFSTKDPFGQLVRRSLFGRKYFLKADLVNQMRSAQVC